MSKSLGNVIDPLDVIDKYGTDAFRFTLVALAAQGRDIRLSDERVEGYRNFGNKIWNAAPLRPDARWTRGPDSGASPRDLTVADRWILSRLQRVIDEVRKALEEYRFNDAAIGALPVRLARVLRLVPGDDQAGPRRRGGGGRP